MVSDTCEYNKADCEVLDSCIECIGRPCLASSHFVQFSPKTLDVTVYSLLMCFKGQEALMQRMDPLPSPILLGKVTVVASVDVLVGHLFAPASVGDIRSIRPGKGLRTRLLKINMSLLFNYEIILFIN